MPDPLLSVSMLGCAGVGKSGEWRVRFLVRNLSASQISLQEGWLPHGRFRGRGRVPLNVALESGEEMELNFEVRASESPGTTVENAFLILRTDAKRVFTRMRIEFDGTATAHPIVEQVTSQPVE